MMDEWSEALLRELWFQQALRGIALHRIQTAGIGAGNFALEYAGAGKFRLTVSSDDWNVTKEFELQDDVKRETDPEHRGSLRKAIQEVICEARSAKNKTIVCARCRFFRQFKCHRHAPYFAADRTGACWPDVAADYWCGDFERRVDLRTD
jgi:hypothetical protein